MANGQQEEQQLPQVGTTQQPSLYQSLGSMKPDELIQFKGFLNKYKGQRELNRNVGGDRAAELMAEVETGGITMKGAIEQSKVELTPTMKDIDKAFFAKDASPSTMLMLKERVGQNWTRNERNLWFSHYNRLQSKENSRLVQEGKLSKTQASNNKFALKAQVDYHNIEDAIYRGTKDLFKADKYGNVLQDAQGNLQLAEFDRDGVKAPSMTQEDLDMLNEHWGFIRSEIKKDLNPSTFGGGDQLSMQRSLAVIANIVPKEYLQKKRGIFIGDDFIDTYTTQLGENAMRKLYFDSLNKQLTNAKDHLTNIVPLEAETEAVGKWSDYEIDK